MVNAQEDLITVAPSNVVGIIGETVQLHCSYNESRGDTLYFHKYGATSWARVFDSDNDIPSATHQFTDGEYTFTVNNSVADDANEYMCRVYLDATYEHQREAASIVLYGK